MVGRAVEKIREHRGWYIFEALLFIIIGVMALSMPEITAITFEFLLATLFIIGGTIRFLNGIVMPYHRWWQIISGLIYAITGAMIFTWPITGLSALLIAVGALLFTEGVFEIGIALALRPAKNWKWMLLAGITSIMLAMLIIIGFPYAGIMFIAIAMGLSFMFYGVSVLAIALKCKKQTSSKKETGHENLRS
jgi:uncharacterized membrane protein HdeD (DUF308 family)